jgi:hypothetical protein
VKGIKANAAFGTKFLASGAAYGNLTQGIMNPGNSISPNSKAWRGLYRAALFEVDKTRLPDRIAPWWEEWKWLFAAIGVVLGTIATLIKFWR